ncbi:MAG: hypothetical protein Q9201_002577 [Fulgogasparrea decipioides]
MEECVGNHDDCSEQSATQDNSSRPARLLELKTIQRNNESGIRLIETVSGSSYQYACLSHRFDDAVKRHRTTAGNLSDFRQFINLEKLPKNWRDAISIARDLHIDYLWIDSVCIIQDGDGGDDLRRELAKMGFIYQKAHLTIAAISSPSSSGGCFIKDKWPDKCIRVSTTSNEEYLIGARILDQKGRPVSTDDVNDRYPVLSRGWVFQERLMSTRLLLCNYGEFAFECLKSSRCECESSLAPHLGKKSSWFTNLGFTQQRRLLLQDAQGALSQGERDAWKHNALNYWKTIVGTYMQLNLTHSSDVLPAIARCAQTLAPHLHLNYVAGMWKETLATDLLWYVMPLKAKVGPKPRPNDTTAPSWSWGSVSMGQAIFYIQCQSDRSWSKSSPLLQDAIKEIYCEPQPATNQFGKLEDAHLRLDAVLYPWYLRLFCNMAMGEVAPWRRKWVKDLYIERSAHSKNCTTNPPELALQGGVVELRLDGRLKDEELKPTPFKHCVGTQPHLCRLIQIYLLPVLHKESSPRTLDVFLLLNRILPVKNKTNCYRRIGLMKLTNEEGKTRTWDKIVDGRIKPQKEEFWLL